jgi:hypothetical protein
LSPVEGKVISLMAHWKAKTRLQARSITGPHSKALMSFMDFSMAKRISGFQS